MAAVTVAMRENLTGMSLTAQKGWLAIGGGARRLFFIS
jgi:hypothetical protein